MWYWEIRLRHFLTKSNPLYRLRLASQLSLALSMAAFLAVITISVFMAWNLRAGFADYLQHQDEAYLEQFAHLAAKQYTNNDNINQFNIRKILAALAQANGIDAQVNERVPPPHKGERSPPNRPAPPQHDGSRFGDRVAIYSIDGEHLQGPLLIFANDKSYIQQPIMVKGKTLAYVRLLLAKPATDSIEMQFLQRQYGGILLISLTLIIIALVVARLLSRYWVAPLLAIQQASQRIAQGEFDVRLTNTRHDEIGDVMHNLNTMALELQQLDTNRRHWIANISHELRTPLSVLRGETEAMLDGVRPLTLQAIQSLHEDILCLGRLVDDLHLLSMADVGAFPCYITQVDVKTALNHTLERFKPKAERQQMHVIINNKLPNTCDAQWDYTRIEQLLNNVLDNSLLYSDKKGMIEISLYLDEPHQLKIVIEDSPPHVPDEALTQIFNPLFRLDRARTRQSTGSGLGLAICSAIVKAHHGNIWAAASKHGGLAIHIQLPLNMEQTA